MAAALHSYTHPTWLSFWGSGSHVESKWYDHVMVEADSHLKLLPASILDVCKEFQHIDMLSMGLQYQPYTVTHTLLWLRFWDSRSLIESKWCDCHGWGWQPPQTASHIHIRHIQSVWAHWCAVHWHTEAASNSYTHATWGRFGGSGSLVESTWCHYLMVEAEGHLKLLLASISNINKVFGNIDMLSIGIW